MCSGAWSQSSRLCSFVVRKYLTSRCFTSGGGGALLVLELTAPTGKAPLKLEAPNIQAEGNQSRPSTAYVSVMLGQSALGPLTEAGLCLLLIEPFSDPSSYILNGDGELPAFPVRKACSYLAEENMGTEALLKGRWWLCKRGLDSFLERACPKANLMPSKRGHTSWMG